MPPFTAEVIVIVDIIMTTCLRWIIDDNYRPLKGSHIIYLYALISQYTEPLVVEWVKLDLVDLPLVHILILILEMSLILPNVAHLHICVCTV